LVHENDSKKYFSKQFNISHTLRFTISLTQSLYGRRYSLGDTSTGVGFCDGWRLCLVEQRSLLYIVGLNK